MSPYHVTIEHFVEIAADRERIWRALTDPASVAIWDTGIVAAVDAPADYPVPGQTVRWRYRLFGLPLTLVDRPQEVVPRERLRTSIALAFLRLDETYTLAASPANAVHTRLGICLRLGNTLPVLGRAFDRHIGRGLARETITQSLSAIRDFCEKN
jgi:hypothetical protein